MVFRHRAQKGRKWQLVDRSPRIGHSSVAKLCYRFDNMHERCVGAVAAAVVLQRFMFHLLHPSFLALPSSSLLLLPHPSFLDPV